MLQREDFLRRVGNMNQLCGVNRYTIDGGKADGIKLFHLYNAKGLEFNVVESRCLDIFDMKYKGINLPFVAKPGLVSRALAEPHGTNFLRSIGGGMLYTCGLSNVGAAYSDSNADHAFHGRLRFIPAENASIIQQWQDGTYRIGVSGEMRDTALLKENLVLFRTVTTTFDSKTITLSDVVENQSFEAQPLMLMYHINCGYPLVDEGLKVYIPASEVIPLNSASEKGQSKWMQVTAPVDGQEDNAFIHHLRKNEDSTTIAGIYNEKLQLGLYVRYDAEMLENLIEWKSMKSGDYVFGLNPANCCGNGKEYEEKYGSLKSIQPFEKKCYKLELTVIDEKDDLERFEKEYNLL